MAYERLRLLNTLPLKSFVPHSTDFTQHPTLTTNGQTSYRQLKTHLDRDSHIHLNFALISCFMLTIVLFTYFWSSDPLSHPYSSPHPHTLFTRLILIFIFLITSFRYHITPHLISPSIIHIPRLSPISSLTSYYSTQCISTHPPSYKYHDHLTFTS